MGQAFINRVFSLNETLELCNLSRREPGVSHSDTRLRHLSVNLADPDFPGRVRDSLEDFLDRGGGEPILLINNAGLGGYGPFPVAPTGRDQAMADLNVRAPMLLTAMLMSRLRERGGAIINVASTAAFQALPGMATYAASKAFLLSWSLALREELRSSGVRVQALCPGPTQTDFFRNAGFDPEVGEGSAVPFSQAPDRVVEASLRGLERDRSIVVPGCRNRLLATASSLAPRSLAASIAGRMVGSLRLERFRQR